ncbi:hypothetical protein [Rhodococcus sp. NPDC058521]|uniref:hypothetical protein n=1 Tax=Rhodococcus sp. NPDC058521 TaxID=3346536 RepID=UPI0036660C9E
MSDTPRRPSDFETVEERRARVSGQVRAWCEDSRIDGRHEQLSDDAAVLVASGYLDQQTREVLAARRRAGKTIPSIGGFGVLRGISDEYGEVARKVDAMKPGPAQLVFKYRATELAKKLRTMRAAVVHSNSHYASGVRQIRRDRRQGVHLDPQQRDALFAALQRTPAPSGGRWLSEAGNLVRNTAADRLADLSGTGAVAGLGRRVAGVIGRGTDPEHDEFADPYDTLLFLAGMLYDRVDGSATWHSEHFAIQRHQLDLAQELTQIAVDAIALRAITAELADADRSAHGDAAREQIRSRQLALRPVWDQLVDRVAALARIGDLVGQAEVQLRSVSAVRRTMSLDSRIDDLIARSGNRELSAENTHFVGDQFTGVDELLGTYQNALYGDIAALTAWSDSGEREG